MKIKGLKTFVVGNPAPHFGGRYFIFLKLITDDGIEGVGEVYCATFSPHIIVKMIEDVFEHHVEGSNPFQIEALCRNVYGRGYTLRPDVSLMGVLSGLEIALWDICGKSVDKPVFELLGGKVLEKLRSYTYLYPKDGAVYTEDEPHVYNNPELAAEAAADLPAASATPSNARLRREGISPVALNHFRWDTGCTSSA